MLKDILVGIARQNVVVDVAMEVVETLTYETRMAAIMLPVTGVGVGLTIAALLAAVLTGGHPAALVAVAVGVLMAALEVSTETATGLLIERAGQLGIPVAELAQQVVDNAQQAEELIGARPLRVALAALWGDTNPT